MKALVVVLGLFAACSAEESIAGTRCAALISSAGTRYANDSFKALDSAIRSEARAGFSGIVLIGDSSNILFSQGCGSAKIADTVAADLPFWLASNSKQVAAAVIMRLQDRGKLRVTDSITRFFRAVPPDKQSITLHQLLTHTAGFPHEYRADGIVERDRAVTEILALKSVGKPGEKFSYSNDGYSLLAAVVEIASGVPFDKYVQDSMFRASGLERSGVWGHERADIPVAPVADAKQLLKQRPNIHASGKSVANWGYRGPTGVYSSARDVYQWLTALRSGKVITPEAFRQLVGRHVPVRTDSAGSSYTAYGWGVRVEGDRDRWYAHSGNEDWLGHNSVIRFTPNGYVVVVLSNSGDVGEVGWATRVNRVVREVMSASM